ncbi:hypothetical protein [uncultured Mucilaginibacter sp.]|uniref:hypothetical protein n=1 Tax=uncultured Mucilaginibacter sp. TaxID=797541 RepID=UPI0025DFBE48|nr:hypothetical protein [uncultured Mucilaginibacter sp.]
MPKYCFRKVYFICTNKQVIEPAIKSAVAYKNKDYADILLDQRDKSVKMWDVNKPPKTYSVEGFYLVHERLFDELLKEHSK